MSATTDDPWADLYTELEVENAAKTATPPPQPIDDTEDDGDPADDEPDEGGEVGAEGDASPGEGDQPRKRRRRRRRRKGRGGNGEQLPADGEGLAATDGDDLPPDSATGEETEEEAGEPADPSHEMIRNWNVPSWAEIVAGLHRPG